eukprot:gnl/Spiro4/25417_TR12678_c0_g1_i1.p2 gnl/Spiro4/25417_TR12678_c0_g1~~gnl/Spiro4/25417_TR12678_c0_g1_i1.p2  ORF type:complete len:294 (-),score=60.83 gnl/Spiro4/25417_TR12678_c0_g1_i1:111-962(-)
MGLASTVSLLLLCFVCGVVASTGESRVSIGIHGRAHAHERAHAHTHEHAHANTHTHSHSNDHVSGRAAARDKALEKSEAYVKAFQSGQCWIPCTGGHGCPPIRDRCCRHSKCAQCVSDPACGWCEATSTCRSGGQMGPGDFNCSVWNWGFCAGEPCKNYDSCHTCTQDPFCGYCGQTNLCHEGNQYGPVQAQCHAVSWSHQPEKCGSYAQPTASFASQMEPVPASPVLATYHSVPAVDATRPSAAGAQRLRSSEDAFSRAEVAPRARGGSIMPRIVRRHPWHR